MNLGGKRMPALSIAQGNAMSRIKAYRMKKKLAKWKYKN